MTCHRATAIDLEKCRPWKERWHSVVSVLRFHVFGPHESSWSLGGYEVFVTFAAMSGVKKRAASSSAYVESNRHLFTQRKGD